MKIPEIYNFLKRKFPANFTGSAEELQQDLSIWENVFRNYSPAILEKSVQDFILKTEKIYPGDNILAVINTRAELIAEEDAELRRKLAIANQPKIESRFFIDGKPEEKTEICREHEGECAMNGKGSFVCGNCLRAADKILSNPILNGADAVRWAIKVDIAEYGDKSEYKSNFPKIPDEREAGGYRLDRRPDWMKEEKDSEKLEAWQKKQAEVLAKYYSDQRMGRKSYGSVTAQEKK